MSAHNISTFSITRRSHHTCPQRPGIFAAVLLLLLNAAPFDALSQTSGWKPKVSGNDLYEQCERVGILEEKLAGGMICGGFIIGIGDSGTHKACPPGEIDLSQVTKAVVAWLKNHPDILDDSAARLVARALEETYPCR